METILNIATNASTPLMIAGFLAGALFLIARQILKLKLFAKLTRQLSADIIKLLIDRLFILALVALFLGFAGFVIQVIIPQIDIKTSIDVPQSTTSISYSVTPIDWISIQGGEFEMGTAKENIVLPDEIDETPRKKVRVSTFYISKTEVTVGQYWECVHAKKCTAPVNYTKKGCLYGREGYDDYPVNCVNWQQAVEFASFVNGRLPTEAEWEFAATSRGLRNPYPWGSEKADCSLAVMDDGAGPGCGSKIAHKVCSKPKGNTEQGLCDMAGNIYELVGNWYQKQPYQNQPYTQDGIFENPHDPDLPDFKGHRLLKGGSGYSKEVDRTLRAANRGYNSHPGSRWHGFRVVFGIRGRTKTTP